MNCKSQQKAQSTNNAFAEDASESESSSNQQRQQRRKRITSESLTFTGELRGAGLQELPQKSTKKEGGTL
eukprot:8666195-Ditylum_brightwellii.AAC.1